jgi:hypothetical protein
MTVRPKVKIAIQYDPEGRGVRLALAYCRIRRRSQPFFDLYGTCVGYCGGGAYGDFYFHVGEPVGVGFVSFTPSFDGRTWHEDRIGVSGLAGQDIADDICELLEYVQGRLWTRWCCSTEEGNPDLRAAAKRRLDCEKQPVFYISPSFNEDLLAFLSPEWGISVDFGEVEGGWERQRRQRLARKRASRRGFVAVLVKYPHLIETGLRLVSNRAVAPCGRSILIFADSRGGELAVACQWEPVTERDVERIKGLELELPAQENGRDRVVVVATSIDPAVQQLLEREGVSWREITSERLREFLSEERDLDLCGVFGFTPVTDLSCQLTSCSGLPIPDSTITALECDSEGLPHLEGIEFPGKIKTLDARGTSVKDLTPLCALASLERLDLSDCFELIDASPLGSLPHLKRLDLACSSELERLPARWSGPLESLSLCGTRLRSLDGLPGSLNSLELRTCNKTGTIVLTQCDQIESLAPLAGTGLVRTATRIELDGCAKLRTLAGIEALRALKTVLLDPTIADVSALSKHKDIRIEVSWAESKAFPESLARALSMLPRMKLAIFNAEELEDCSALAAITSLVELDMGECPKVKDLAWVVGLPALRRLRLGGSPAAVEAKGVDFGTKAKVRALQQAICMEESIPLPPHLGTAPRSD